MKIGNIKVWKAKVTQVSRISLAVDFFICAVRSCRFGFWNSDFLRIYLCKNRS